MDSFTPGPETSRAFRDTLGCFATGITVITCVDVTGPLAMTGDQSALAARFATDGRAFRPDEWAADAQGTPLLSNCLARFVCKRFAIHPAGDHTLILGQVTQASKGTGTPLVFAQGKYGQFTNGS
jgi:flavin reductase (DIM6/NTAB) family NADH-FMN oxidoreductase RutF